MPKRYIIFFLWCLALQGRAQRNDCNLSINKPIVSVSKAGRPAVAALTTVCQDSLVQLNLKNHEKGTVVQWRLNNTDIPNATDTILVIRNNQAGVYTCIVKNNVLCTNPVISDPVAITLIPKPIVGPVMRGGFVGTPCVDGYEKLTVTATGNSSLSYQWLSENRPIERANSTSYDVIETGVYSVRVTDSDGCATVSGNLTVIPATPPKAEISASKGGFCAGENVTLFSTRGRTNVYQWMRDGQPIGGIKDTIIIAQAGVYSVKVTAPNSCSTTSLPITVIRHPEPVVSIESPGNEFCPGAALPLTAAGTDLKKFEWMMNGQPIKGASKNKFEVNVEGSYSVSVTDTNGCKAVAKAVEVKKVDKITVRIDSLPDFCGPFGSPIPLKGIPSGGIFSGTGVVNETFDSKLAGVGEHVVTYVVQGALDCLNGEAQKKVIVSRPPTLNLGEDRIIFQGSSLSLDAELGIGYTYQWTPTAGVDNPVSPKALFRPEQTTTYHIVATGPMGCLAEDSITITVFSGVYVPDVFTPNGDGQNDTWELKGLEQYPQAQITIFNRWGQAVFNETGEAPKPFDGTFNGSVLPVGEYAYVILTEPNGHVLRGKVLLLR
ncbi:gliding motility-associated C-terminal domain-containing protein [Runella salmonicolor]|uniref:Gliding motility-associated C-terminal domain-containing protein n=1 Tax=Runella salmonicolor TaxID=2950278 RepID=A0ABT1FL69_9BACT|nr:gliding motility-associated C-terminal domain-containing protein [Runella salmonicolor]MCP1382452.1 gliding motility-associated C-terminal domain-containing protein [Runella salmonicolor]